MIYVQVAEALILQLVQPFERDRDSETVELGAATGRILAQPVTSQLDFPHWDNSAMDGYAVRFADVKNCTQARPATLDVVAEIPAGCVPKIEIQAGQAARIFTGAMLPPSADTVVMQENTQAQQQQVQILVAPDHRAFVRQQGSFYRAGETLLGAKIRIDAPEIAILAAAGCQTVQVYRRPRVAIISTGDELVPLSVPLQPGQIVDSNQYALSTFVQQLGAIPLPLGIVADTPEALEKAVSQAIASADIVLSTGGVSVGDYDYVDRVLEKLGGDLQIRAVAIKPGKPLTVAAFEQNCLYFGIPGNPVSALVSCWRFVRPAIAKLSGLDSYLPQFVKAKTNDPLKSGGKRETYLWGRLRLSESRYEFHLAGGSHSSGNLINLAQTNALAVLPVGTTQIAAGDEVRVMLVA